MHEYSAQQLYDYLQTDEKPLLLDVREPWEYEVCHIQGSKLIPMQTIPAKISQLDPDQETVVICHHGVRSRMVGRFLQQAGFKNVINLAGGVKSWAEQVDTNMPVY